MEKQIIQLNSPRETAAFAAALARQVKAPAIFCLHGSLGAGKTHFAQGFAMGLGISEPVSSPTFSLLNRYPIPGSAAELLHFDLYRLEDPYLEWEMLGFSELMEAENISLLEWPERISELIPATAYEIRLIRPAEAAVDLPSESRIIEVDGRLGKVGEDELKLSLKELEDKACCN